MHSTYNEVFLGGGVINGGRGYSSAVPSWKLDVNSSLNSSLNRSLLFIHDGEKGKNIIPVDEFRYFVVVGILKKKMTKLESYLERARRLFTTIKFKKDSSLAMLGVLRVFQIIQNIDIFPVILS